MKDSIHVLIDTFKSPHLKEGGLGKRKCDVLPLEFGSSLVI